MDEFTDMPPPWAAKPSNGNYIIGAQLPTRDGRRCGNAHIIEIAFSETLGQQLHTVLTDAGNTFRATVGELEGLFHPTVWAGDLSEILRKFSPREEQCHGSKF